MSERLEQLQKLVRIAPDDPMSHYGVGLELVQLERWHEAAAAFSEATRVDPKYSAAYYHKARAEIATNEPERARATLNQGMAIAREVGDWHTEGEMQQLLDSIS